MGVVPLGDGRADGSKQPLMLLCSSEGRSLFRSFTRRAVASVERKPRPTAPPRRPCPDRWLRAGPRRRAGERGGEPAAVRAVVRVPAHTGFAHPNSGRRSSRALRVQKACSARLVPRHGGANSSAGRPVVRRSSVPSKRASALPSRGRSDCGGQAPIRSTLHKVEEAATLREHLGYGFEISVDGGVNAATAGDVTAAGADILVVGTGLFRGDIRANRRAIADAIQDTSR